jgi:hypothetical protein
MLLICGHQGRTHMPGEIFCKIDERYRLEWLNCISAAALSHDNFAPSTALYEINER